MKPTDWQKVRGVIVTVECWNCNGDKRVKPEYRRSNSDADKNGEVVDCPICHGHGTTREEITLSLLYDLLNGNL